MTLVQGADRDDTQLIRDETNHRIQNHLALVSSMLRLAAEESGDVDPAEELRLAADRIGAVASLHRYLVGQTVSHHLQIDSLLVEWCSTLSRVTTVPVVFSGGAPSVEFESETALRLVLVVNEIVTQGLRAAVKAGTIDEVRVSSAVSGGGLTVWVEHAAEVSNEVQDNSVSDLILKGFTSRIGAEVSFDLVEDKTVSVVRLPIN
jgi:two-component sensor histidine kinase